MPIYEYRCTSCGFQKEYLQKVTDPLLSSCPECGKASFRKLLSAAGFQLKGSGWSATDFKGAGAKPQADKKDAAKTDGAKTEGTKTEGTTTETTKTEAPASGGGASAATPVAESGS